MQDLGLTKHKLYDEAADGTRPANEHKLRLFPLRVRGAQLMLSLDLQRAPS